MNWLRLVFWFMLVSSFLGAIVMGWMGWSGHHWWWFVSFGEFLTTYALSEILHTLYKRTPPPHPSSMYYKKFGNRFK